MSKKIKAIITVEIDDVDDVPPLVECRLENGNKILLKRENLIISIPAVGQDSDVSSMNNFRVTC